MVELVSCLCFLHVRGLVSKITVLVVVAPRSGLAHKHFIDVGAGVIDYDYRGNVGVILFNHNDTPFEVKRGDRIAQLILERISMALATEVDDLDSTERGSGGFGSTGVSAAAKPDTSSPEKKRDISAV